MEFIGDLNINDNPELKSMMDHNLKPVNIYYAGDYEREEKNSNGHTTHILYWNLPIPVWNENEVMIMERGNSVTCYLGSKSSKAN